MTRCILLHNRVTCRTVPGHLPINLMVRLPPNNGYSERLPAVNKPLNIPMLIGTNTIYKPGLWHFIARWAATLSAHIFRQFVANEGSSVAVQRAAAVPAVTPASRSLT